MAFKSLTGFDANNQRIVQVADPSSGADAANKSYVDNVAAGLDWKENVRAASTANMTIASAVINGATMDGVSLVTGDRVLLKNQSTGAENGIYIVAASGAASRSTDADSSADVKNMIVRVAEGTVNADTMYQLITDAVTLGSTALVFTQFSGGGTTYTADGNGIELTSTTFSLELDGTSLSKGSSGLRIGSAAAAAGLTESSGLLSVGAGTGIIVNANDVAVDPTVVTRKYAANCVATTNPQTFNHALNNADAEVQVIEVSSKKVVLADITLTDANNISVDFGGAPTSAQYRVEVQG